MANSMPFNSIEHDRTYKAEDWAWYFATFIGNGIFPKPNNGLQVVAYNGMEVTVNAGYAFINGYAFRNPTNKNITIDMAESAMNRIDRIVVRWDLTVRDIYLEVLKGVPSARPTPTEVTRSAEIWELALCDIYIEKGTTNIRTADITDQRFNSNVCGIVKGTIEEIDASTLTQQFDDFFSIYKDEIEGIYGKYVDKTEKLYGEYSNTYNEELRNWEAEIAKAHENFLTNITNHQNEMKNKFDEWFENVKDKLGGDAAGKLQLQIEELTNTVKEMKKREDEAEESAENMSEDVRKIKEMLQNVLETA